ncbi:MAG: hypothetical protein SVY10_14720 [Thermodesulfobacteriota bacterium]|nr:hypothetical protein [Thermodesulfobacteriota bacterium]
MQFTIRMPDEYGEKIASLAHEMGLKKSDIAWMALKQFLDEKCGTSKSKPFRKVQHLIGSAESGIKDLGQRHSYYLASRMRKASS